MSDSIVVTSNAKEPIANNVGELAKTAPEELVKSATEEVETKEDSETSEEKGDAKASTDEDSGQEAKGDDEKKKKNNAVKRIKKLTANNYELKARIAFLEGQMSAKSEKPAEKVESKKAEGKPRAEDFEKHEDYVEALADWKLEQKLAERDEKAKKTEAQEKVTGRVKTYQERVKEFVKDHEDFHEVMDEIGDVQMSITVQEILLDAENGPEIAYHLGKNKKEFERICKLPPLQAARELAFFEAKNITKESSKEKVETKTTKAPKPITPLGGASTKGKKSIFDKDLTYAEYEALRTEERKKKSASGW